jgi:hypothetical protein
MVEARGWPARSVGDRRLYHPFSGEMVVRTRAIQNVSARLIAAILLLGKPMPSWFKWTIVANGVLDH